MIKTVFVDKDGHWHLEILETDTKKLAKLWIPVLVSGILRWLVYVAESKYLEKEGKELPKPVQKLLNTVAYTPGIIEVLKVAMNWFGHLVSDMAGSKLVSESISSGLMYEGETWKKLIANVKAKNSTLHFIGLVSNGNVHAHIDHLYAMVEQAHKEGVKKIRVHALLDGRDVDPTSALTFVTPLEEKLASYTDSDYQIASGGGRMFITMDRYNADWPMVQRGWYAHVLGEGRQFESAKVFVDFEYDDEEVDG